VVLNRVTRQNRLPLAEIEQTLGHPIRAQVPNDGQIVPDAVNRGVPFVTTSPNSPVALAIRQYARSLAGLSNMEKTMMLNVDELAGKTKGLFFGR
jgi:Flp pilus assembly CpaE family ATPase